MAGCDSLHQLIVANPWICKGPLLWTDKHLELLGIKFQPTGPLVPFPSICRSICDPSVAYGKGFVAGLTSEAKRAAFVKIFQSLTYGLVHLTEEKAVLLYAGKKVHTTSCWISQPLPPGLYEYPIIGYFHYDDVKWDRLESIQPKDNPGARTDGNAPVARLYCRRLKNATPPEWSKDPYLIRLVVTTDQDPKTIHVFMANVSIRLLDCIYWPGLSLEGVTWPVIHHLQVSAEPVCNFPDRLLFEVLGLRCL